jgi:hypothetical protein
MWFDILKVDDWTPDIYNWSKEATLIMEKLLKELEAIRPFSAGAEDLNGRFQSLYIKSRTRLSWIRILNNYIDSEGNPTPPNVMTLLMNDFRNPATKGHWYDITPEEVIVKVQEFVNEMAEKDKAKEKAKQYVIDTANKLDYVRIEGDTIFIEADWMKRQNAFPHHADGIYFTLDYLNGNMLCVKYFSGEKLHRGKLCLRRSESDETPIGDSYVTVMLMAATSLQWKSMWWE